MQRALWIPALCAVALLAGCGSSRSSSGTTGTSGTSTRHVTDFQVESCLNSHGIEYKKVNRGRDVVNLKVSVTTTSQPMTANLNIFPTAQAASTYVGRVRDSIESGGGSVSLHGNVMFATDGVVLPADQPDISPIENCASP